MPPGLKAATCVASILPDLDSLGFAAGIPYGRLSARRSLRDRRLESAAFAVPD